MTYLCCRIWHITDGRETTVGIRRGVVCCGRGGELKDGGPVFIYKYPYFCVLSCKLCRNWQEQGCVLSWGSMYNPKDSMNGCLMFAVIRAGASYQCSAQSAVNHHQTDVEATSPLRPRWRGAVLKVNYCLVKNVTLSAETKKSLQFRSVESSARWKHLLAPLR